MNEMKQHANVLCLKATLRWLKVQAYIVENCILDVIVMYSVYTNVKAYVYQKMFSGFSHQLWL